jgi:hypothetical protein
LRTQVFFRMPAASAAARHHVSADVPSRKQCLVGSVAGVQRSLMSTVGGRSWRRWRLAPTGQNDIHKTGRCI